MDDGGSEQTRWGSGKWRVSRALPLQCRGKSSGGLVETQPSLLFRIMHAAWAGGVAKAEGASAARRAGWQPSELRRYRFHISMSATLRPVAAAVESIDRWRKRCKNGVAQSEKAKWTLRSKHDITSSDCAGIGGWLL